MARAPIDFYCPGLVDFAAARRWQEQRVAAVAAGAEREAFVLLQHPPVFTRGARSRPEHLLVAPSELRACGAAVIDTDRGGDITFHGPGQIVGYPVLHLRGRGIGPVEYVRRLEGLLIGVLAAFGLKGGRVPGRPGVWAGGQKIASIGIRVRSGVSSHGFALNVATDLSWFEAIIPCGLKDATVTSMAALLHGAPDTLEVEAEIATAFCREFGVELVSKSFGPVPEGEGVSSRPGSDRAFAHVA